MSEADNEIMSDDKWAESVSKMMSISELPRGPYERYLRDIWAYQRKFNGVSEDFETWKIQYHKDEKIRLEILNRDHPIEHNHKFQLTSYVSVRIFKREGMDWECSECDMAQNGGSGNASLSTVLQMIEANCESQFEKESLIFCERKKKEA